MAPTAFGTAGKRHFNDENHSKTMMHIIKSNVLKGIISSIFGPNFGCSTPHLLFCLGNVRPTQSFAG